MIALVTMTSPIGINLPTRSALALVTIDAFVPLVADFKTNTMFHLKYFNKP